MKRFSRNLYNVVYQRIVLAALDDVSLRLSWKNFYLKPSEGLNRFSMFLPLFLIRTLAVP